MGPTSTILVRISTEPASRAGMAQQLLTTTTTHDADQSAVLVAAHMPMAARIARSFAGRGEELDDLIQVAMFELVKAATRFNPARGVVFAQYAYPCIIGGLKKHLRDNGWSLHITRRMQELYLQTSQAIPGLSQTLGRTPTITDLAVHLHLSEQDTRDVINSSLAYTTHLLNTPAVDGEDTELGQLLGDLDARLESVPRPAPSRPAPGSCYPAANNTSCGCGSPLAAPARDRRKAWHLPDARLPADRPLPGRAAQQLSSPTRNSRVARRIIDRATHTRPPALAGRRERYHRRLQHLPRTPVTISYRKLSAGNVTVPVAAVVRRRTRGKPRVAPTAQPRPRERGGGSRSRRTEPARPPRRP